MDNQIPPQQNIPVEQAPKMQPPPPIEPSDSSSLVKKLTIAVAILAVIATIGTGGYLLGTKKNNIVKVATPQITPSPTPTDETEIELAKIKKLLATRMQTTEDQIDATFEWAENYQGKYASGSVHQKNVGGGSRWFGKLENDTWTIVHIGNGLPMCSEISKYNLPSDFLSCY